MMIPNVTQAMQQIILPSLCNKEPDLLPPIVSFSFWPMRIRCIECRLPSLNICFFGPYPPRPLEELPEQIQHEIYRYTYIGSDEIVVIKLLCLARKRVEAIEQKNDTEEAEGEPGGVGLEARLKDERVAADALSA